MLSLGYSVFGNIKRNSENFTDFRKVVDEEKAVWLGKFVIHKFAIHF